MVRPETRSQEPRSRDHGSRDPHSSRALSGGASWLGLLAVGSVLGLVSVATSSLLAAVLALGAVTVGAYAAIQSRGEARRRRSRRP